MKENAIFSFLFLFLDVPISRSQFPCDIKSSIDIWLNCKFVHMLYGILDFIVEKHLQNMPQL